MNQQLQQFKCSYECLQVFYQRWMQTIEQWCSDADCQRQAAFYVWARYSMSIRTLDALSDPALIPDQSVILRGCIEFDVSLEALMRYPELAKDYLEFEKHGNASYLKLFKKQGDLKRYLHRRQQFVDDYGEDPEKFKWDKWCVKKGGITGLIRDLGRDVDFRTYMLLCHFTHGSILAMRSLDGRISNPETFSAQALNLAYAAYLCSTEHFLRLATGTVVFPDGEECKRDFDCVMKSYI